MVRSTGSASAEAARKRSIARRFNDVLTSRSPKAKALDKRTARRLERYRGELKQGRKAKRKELSPLDVAMRVNELLKYGDRISDIRKLSKPRQIEYEESQMVALLREMHPVYLFRAEAYRFAGVSNETLLAAGVLDKIPARRGPKAGRAPSSPARRGKRPAAS
jgi:hypothetical protein